MTTKPHGPTDEWKILNLSIVQTVEPSVVVQSPNLNNSDSPFQPVNSAGTGQVRINRFFHSDTENLILSLGDWNSLKVKTQECLADICRPHVRHGGMISISAICPPSMSCRPNITLWVFSSASVFLSMMA